MGRFDRTWVFITLALVVVVFTASLLAFPQWAESWQQFLVLSGLVAAAVVGVVALDAQSPGPVAPSAPAGS